MIEYYDYWKKLLEKSDVFSACRNEVIEADTTFVFWSETVNLGPCSFTQGYWLWSKNKNLLASFTLEVLMRRHIALLTDKELYEMPDLPCADLIENLELNNKNFHNVYIRLAKSLEQILSKEQLRFEEFVKWCEQLDKLSSDLPIYTCAQPFKNLVTAEQLLLAHENARSENNLCKNISDRFNEDYLG